MAPPHDEAHSQKEEKGMGGPSRLDKAERRSGQHKERSSKGARPSIHKKKRKKHGKTTTGGVGEGEKKINQNLPKDEEPKGGKGVSPI